MANPEGLLCLHYRQTGSYSRSAGQGRRRPLTQDMYLLFRGTGSALPEPQNDLQQVTGVNISDHHHTDSTEVAQCHLVGPVLCPVGISHGIPDWDDDDDESSFLLSACDRQERVLRSITWHDSERRRIHGPLKWTHFSHKMRIWHQC